MKTSVTIKRKFRRATILSCLIVLLFPIFIAATFSAELKKEPTKIALIITIGDYPKYPDSEMTWQPLSSHNDIAPIRLALLSKGFQKKNIIVLKDKDAPKEKIRFFIETKLVEMSRKGGYVVIHFSRHGQQMVDDNGDEADGLDEAIIPYDAKKKYVAQGYEGENHLRDTELNESLIKLREKLGKNGQVLVLLDACHAGTGLRKEAIAKIRGTNQIFSSPGFQIDKAKKEAEVKFLMPIRIGQKSSDFMQRLLINRIPNVVMKKINEWVA